MLVSLNFKTQPAPALSEVRLHSARLMLRPVLEADASDIFREFTSDITEYMLPKPPEALPETLAFIHASQQGMAKQRELVCVIQSHRDDRFLGCCGLHARQTWPEPELGIWIRADAHGYGYGREAVHTLATWGFEHLHAAYLVYPVDCENKASRAIAESLNGVVFAEKKVPTQRGTWLNEVAYRIPRPIESAG
ncbi:MAG: GNAT family N-acetyltransferase [Bacteroidetes bacterium]|nr:GNAT family N-acetyltransferase [Bacteroidota bacterium]